METLPSSSGGRSPLVEKIIKYGIPIGIGIAIFWFWGTVSAFVAMATKNLFNTIVYGAPCVFVLGAFMLYPKFWWMQYKNILHYMMSWFINMDPLSFMDRYVDILREKLANVNKTRIELKGRKVASERKIAQLTADIAANLKQGEAALKLGDKKTASLAGTRAAGMRESVKLYTPNYQKMVKSCEFLDALAENWDISITKLSEEVARKREEYEMLREQAKALNQAEEFIKGDTDAGRIYQESIKALEHNVTGYIAQIDDFETKSKDILAGIKVDNQMQHDDGLHMLDEYMKNGKLLLPDDYSQPLVLKTASFQDASYVEVNKEEKFNLLN